MQHRLVVTRNFLHFMRGDIITDREAVTKILASEHQKFVTRVSIPSNSEG